MTVTRSIRLGRYVVGIEGPATRAEAAIWTALALAAVIAVALAVAASHGRIPALITAAALAAPIGIIAAHNSRSRT